MFSFSSSQGLIERILVDISWDYGWKLCEKSNTWWKEWAKLPKVDHHKKKKSCSIVFWKFYVDGAWNQKKLSIGA
jgi:hypothetical protein